MISIIIPAYNEPDINELVKQINDNIWHHIAIYFDRDEKAYYYVDGAVDRSTIINLWSGSTNNALPFYLARGEILGITDYFNGTIDEVRVSNVVRSEGWINTSYHNQNSPSTFYTVGSPQTRYMTITVENIGNVNLDTDNFNILIGGTTYQCTCNRSYLFPLNTVQFYTTTVFSIGTPTGSKLVKVIADTGVADYYLYVW